MTSVPRPLCERTGSVEAAGPVGTARLGGAGLADLVRAHQASVWRYLRLCGADVHEADDLMQETFVAFATARRTTEPASPQGYLCGIAKNLLCASRRRQRRDVPTADWLDAVDRVTSVEGETEGAARIAALRACLQRLTERAQRALAWRHLDGLPRTEVASRLGLGDEGAKSLLERARETLRDCVQRRLVEEEGT